MSVFARSFPSSALVHWDFEHPDNVVRALFKRVAYPNVRASRDEPLRLAVRDGYIEFYVRGQSLAKLSCKSNGPELTVHQAYVSGQRPESHLELKLSQDYVAFDADALADPSTCALVDGWIETANCYSSADNRFIDDLLSSNPGIIDIAADLPTESTAEHVQVIPRMNIAIAQIKEGTPSIAFWNAKCARSPVLRSIQKEGDPEGDAPDPEVIHHLREYTGWMAEPGRIEQLTQAFKTTASVYLHLHQHFSKNANRSLLCISIWKALVRAEDSLVVVQPGLVVAGYWPHGYLERIAHARMGQAAQRFSRRRNTLERGGFDVHEIHWEGESLPTLLTKPVTD